MPLVKQVNVHGAVGGVGQWETTRILSTHALNIWEFQDEQMKKCFLVLISQIGTGSLGLFSLFKIWNNLSKPNINLYHYFLYCRSQIHVFSPDFFQIQISVQLSSTSWKSLEVVTIPPTLTTTVCLSGIVPVDDRCPGVIFFFF